MIRKRKNNIDLIIFDLDGTLIDTALYIVMDYTHMFDKYHLHCPSLTEMVYFSGPPLEEVFKKYFPNIPVKELVDEFHAYSLKYSNHYSSLYPFEVEVLQELKEAGYHLALLTTKSKNSALQNLDYFKLTPFFECIVTVEECPKPKPDPSGVKIILDRLQLSPTRSFTIGDSPSDLICGEALGLKSGLVTWGLKHIPDCHRDEEYASFKDIERSFIIHD
jgi:pyrophosphatase PpaX